MPHRLSKALHIFGLTVFLAGGIATADAADPPRVVTTIKPIHSLVSGVMNGIGVPALLLPDGASPHAYAMRPSDARSLRHADLIVWVGPELETFLERPLATLGRHAEVLALLKSHSVRTLPVRGTGIRNRNRLASSSNQNRHSTSDHDGAHDTHTAGERDPHIWLDPANAAAITGLVAERLTKLNPANATRYHANARAVSARLAELDGELNALMAPVKQLPFFVYHDAFQYFETHYGLTAAGSITPSPERKPGARRLSEIRRRIAATGVRCVFSEPQIQPAVVRAVTRGTGARHRSLDPMGAGVPPGETAYFRIMKTIAISVAACATTKSR